MCPEQGLNKILYFLLEYCKIYVTEQVKNLKTRLHKLNRLETSIEKSSISLDLSTGLLNPDVSCNMACDHKISGALD